MSATGVELSSDEQVCDTCGRTVNHLNVYALPGVPVSVGNCGICTDLDVYPYWVLVANTASVGGIQHAAPWWKDAVVRSLAVVEKSIFGFEADVAELMRAHDEDEEGE